MFRHTLLREPLDSRIGRTGPSRSRSIFLPALALLFTLAAPLARAQTISINFQGGQGADLTPMDPTEVAGVVRVAHWNNAPGATGTLSSLTDSTGATVPGGTVTYSGSPNTWANGLADAPGDNRLLKGYLDTNNTSVTTVAVTGLDAAATYSVYVYATGDSGGRVGQYAVGNQTFYLTEQDGGAFSGTYTQSSSTTAVNATVGNYVVFTVAGQNNFTLTATPVANGNTARAPLNGIQIFKVVQPPAAPTGLAATVADTTATLTWNAVAGASSYILKRSLTPGGPYTTLATGLSGAAYTDAGLTNGTTYYYVVQAVNKNGTSANSNEASAKPVPAVTGTGIFSVNFVGGNGTIVPTPMDPTEVAGAAPAANWNNFTATNGQVSNLLDSAGAATSASVTVGGSTNLWAAGIGDTPGNYRMMEGYLDSGNTTTTSVTLSGLSPSKTYLIYVYAARDNGDSAGLYSIGSQTFVMQPGIFAGTFTQATSTDPTKPTAGNYVVFQVTGQGSYTVTATPDQATGGYRSPINGIQAIVLTAPTAPTNLAAVGLDSSVYLSWTGVAVASSYNVKRSTTPGGPYTTVATGVVGATYTDTGLTNGTTYYYVVSATNSIGTSGNSNEASAKTIAASIGTGNGLYGVYYTPGTVDFSAETTGTVVFSNVVPVVNFNQGNAGVNYNPLPWPSGVLGTQFTAVWSGKFQAPYTGSYVFRTITDDGARLTVNGTVLFDDETGHAPLANTGAAITLTAGQKYDIKFEFTQQGGGRTAQLLYSPLGSGFQIVPQSQLSTNFAQGPDAPTNLIALGHNKSVQLYWTGGLNTASFNVKRSLTAGGPYTTVATGVTAPSFVDTGLTNGTKYYYVVSATNNIGTSSNSNEASATPVNVISTIAYWRFEGGTAGSTVALAPSQIPDLTGKGNTLQTPDAGATPNYSALVPGNPTNPAASNLLSLDFSTPTTNGDPTRFVDTSGATGDINTHTFNQFTIEASFNSKAVGTTQTFVGKDGFGFLGDPTVANATLYFQIQGGVVSIRGHQGDQTFIICDGTTVIQPNQWYNAAAVSDGFFLSLYLQSTPGGAYTLENSVSFVGPLFDGQGLPFSVGRGFYNNTQVDQMNGLVDEVRISDNALDPSQFLFASSGGTTVTGKVALEGVSDLSATNVNAPRGTVHIEFRTPGTTTALKSFDVALTPVGAGSPLGTFSVSGVPAGTYDVALKGSKQLRVVIPNVAFTGSSFALPGNITLPGGDATNDNIVDIGDFGILVNSYNGDATIAGSGYNAAADFNYDGVVDIGDFGVLVNEYNNSGAP